MIRRSALPLVMVVGAMAQGCARPAAEEPSRQAPQTVIVAPAESIAWPSPVDAGGTFRARHSAVIASRILAPVTRILIQPGDTVRRGQTLVELDAAESRAQVTRAVAALGAATQTGAAAAADLGGATSALTLARATHGRIATLAAQKSATPQELDQAIADLAAAEARVELLRARVTEAAAGREAAASAVDAARITASYAVLAAPFDGIVSERRADPGTMAMPGMPLVVVEEAGPLQLEVRLDAARAGQVRLQQTAGVRLDTDPPAEWRAGRVVEIARIDPDGHSFVVKIDVPGDAALRSGMFGRARFDGPSRAVLSVPSAAIVQRGQLAFVFVTADGLARLRAVSPGAVHADRTEILDGLAAGESVILNPASSLSDGARVTTAAPAGGTKGSSR